MFAGVGERTREGNDLYLEMNESGVINKTSLVFGQMNEPPGARLRVGLTGVTLAEYFRDEENQDVLLFIDNIFRFVQAGSEVSALLGRMPSAVGYQPTLGTEMGALQERICSTKKGSITSVQAIYVPADDITDPAPATTFTHLDATTVLSRSISELGIYPAVDPLASTSRILSPQVVGRSISTWRAGRRKSSSGTRSSRTSSRFSAWTSSPRRTSSSSAAREGSSAFSRSRSLSPKCSPAGPGKYVKVQETVRGFKEIIEGKHDDVPEQAFYMVGHDRGSARTGEGTRVTRGSNGGARVPIQDSEPEETGPRRGRRLDRRAGRARVFRRTRRHAPFISTMKEGDVDVRLAEGGEKRFRITGGIFRVEQNSAVLLAESVEEITAAG